MPTLEVLMSERWDAHENTTVTGSEPVDHPSPETVKVRQGTGPRATVSVLLVSLILAAAAGALLLMYFTLGGPPH
jgi:hypothetical protein